MNLDEEVENLLLAVEEKTVFTDIYDLFYDLTDKAEFRKMCVPANNKKIKATVTSIAKKIVKNAVISGFKSVKVDRYKLWHGVFYSDMRMSTFFYFEKLDMGLVSVSGPKDHIDIARFTVGGYSRCTH
ncbi:MAG: hypothetical protein HQK96_19660 [Nitrospirae bacterium]|nr:hypothetical protein [Nitrospirota bacterium]